MAVQSLDTIVINDRMLRSWIRCRRKAWLDKYGDKKKRFWPTYRTLQLDHQHQSFVQLISQSSSKRIGTCQEGASFVFGIKLYGKTPGGHSLKSRPILLQKITGISKWGQFAYQPVIAKHGHKLTRENRLELSLTGLLLQQFQESPVKNGIAISKNTQALEIEDLKLSRNLNDQLLEALRKIKNDLNLEEPPPITANRRKCSICTWKKLCNTEASSQGHLSEISGVGAKRIEILQNLGIHNLKELAICNTNELRNKLGELHGKIAEKIIRQANVQFNKTRERLNFSNPLPELKFTDGVFLYDIESDPDTKFDFLHGFLSLKRKPNGSWDIKNAKYQPLLTLKKEEENLIWKRIKKKLNQHPKWPILHYGETESISILRLAKRHNMEDKELSSLKDRLIDIHYRVVNHWLLPINNYGLKSVANHIGFNWSNENAEGTMALLWWRQWERSRRTGKSYSKNLNSIFNYNRDDCLATWAIADWISDETKDQNIMISL